MLEKLWRKGNLPTLLVGMWIGSATMDNSMEIPQKTKNRVVIWSSNSSPGHIPKQNYNLKRYMCIYVHSSTIYNSEDMETIWMPIDRWMDKEDVIHTHTHTHKHTHT